MNSIFSKKQINLKAWIRQKWKTKSGKKSTITGERVWVFISNSAIAGVNKKSPIIIFDK